ncbi:MAG TPA: ABC transporter permease [Nocardioidaceae bacterium]|jgi:ABC-type transport system involved in multi-copper enzyme maturation permease subunit|nr:ABC transporter permease [Nocardioidaceae bacterium]
MSDALRYEWLRLRTIRSTWWLTGLAIAFGAGIAFLVSWAVSASFDSGVAPRGRELERVAPTIVGQFAGDGAPFFLPYFLAIIGVFTWGHEYRHGMIRATLTALSSRSHAWVAKYLVVGAWAVLVTVVTLLLSALAGWVWLADNGIGFANLDVARVIGKSAGYAVLFAWTATALASLLRNQAAALVLVLLWPLVVENVITLILSVAPATRDLAAATRFLPFNAGAQILSTRDVTGPLFGEPLTPWAGVLVFGGFTAALMAASLVLFRKRDA